MKSLEIVNERIDYYNDGVRTINITIEQLQQIKQDLEVLEILRKYIPENWSGFQIITSNKKTKVEDFKKVKQWLEVNE